MSEILRFLLKYCAFLYETGRFKFVDSGVSPSFGGDAFLVLASDALRMRFVRDRGQLFMDFQSIHHESEKDWYSIDVVQRLVTGERQASAELNEGYVAFLHDHLDDIERLFATQRLRETVMALQKLERARANELFG